jgi:uncharacterized membrane protein
MAAATNMTNAMAFIVAILFDTVRSALVLLISSSFQDSLRFVSTEYD